MILTYPLVTLSTRSQVESKRAQTTVTDATRHIIQREGFSGLYAGLDSAVFGISVTNFVYYYCTIPASPRLATANKDYRVRMVSCGLRDGSCKSRS
jgi:hypothetical protein